MHGKYMIFIIDVFPLIVEYTSYTTCAVFLLHSFRCCSLVLKMFYCALLTYSFLSSFTFTRVELVREAPHLALNRKF